MASRSFSRASVLARLFGQPLAVLPDTAAQVLGAIGPRLNVEQLFIADRAQLLGIEELKALAAAEVARIDAASGIEMRAGKLPADRLMLVQNGVAHVQLRGELVAENEGNIQPSSGFTGYDGIRAQVLAADNDPNVRGLVLDINSPGGECADLAELAAFLLARRGTKPMRAVIRNCGASAAYWIAACADEVTLQPLGVAGSIGVITMHADYSQALANEGVAVTLITSGAHKADGNPFEPLPEGVRARIQSMVDTTAAQFFDHVAAARGMTVQAVRAQQAQVYLGEEALAAGLVDKIMGWQDSIAEFEAAVNGSGRRPAATAPSGARSAKGNTMSTEATAPAADQPEFTKVQLDAAASTARAEGHAEGLKAGTEGERSRISALAELDASSTVSPALTAAIASGETAGDFAIGLAKAAKAQGANALAAAAAEAVPAAAIPAGSGALAAVAEGAEVNRGAAYAAKKTAK